MQPIISGMAIDIICPCGGLVRITLASILYHDAVCPTCGTAWTAIVKLSQDAAARDNDSRQNAALAPCTRHLDRGLQGLGERKC